MQGGPRKRQRLSEDAQAGVLDSPEAAVEADAQPEVLSDTLAAIELLRAQFPPESKAPPLVLRSQVYSLVHDHTVVDRELEEHRQSGRLRMIKLPSSVDDYGYLLQEDYVACIDAAASSEQALKAAAGDLAIFPRFRERVVPACRDASIPHARLLALLEGRSPGGDRQGGAGPAASDRQVSLLLGTGLLTRQVGQQASYLFAVAGGGRLVTSIVKGRKELLLAIGRKRYKEVLLKEAAKWRLGGSRLGARWHLRDLLGRGSLAQTHTPSGPLLRLARPG